MVFIADVSSKNLHSCSDER